MEYMRKPSVLKTRVQCQARSPFQLVKNYFLQQLGKEASRKFLSCNANKISVYNSKSFEKMDYASQKLLFNKLSPNDFEGYNVLDSYELKVVKRIKMPFWCSLNSRKITGILLYTILVLAISALYICVRKIIQNSHKTIQRIFDDLVNAKVLLNDPMASFTIQYIKEKYFTNSKIQWIQLNLLFSQLRFYGLKLKQEGVEQVVGFDSD
ncbi:Hypothetical_protein [Hexamita inflata]|uniref:Hypothetical_protein n=1 Tax=Hexamita inflata TaxID=28002 RepID=A0AA86RJS0_9EUKA|nr:Hypothetical protein HINF_LOCUS63763 [Hexamita inflata]